MTFGVIIFLSLAVPLSWGQTLIEDIKLVNGTYSYAGNLRILYNGTWGTICDSGWSINDARVACRMLGYSDAACALSNARYGRASSSVPIWMSNLGCNGHEQYLDSCPFYGWGSGSHYCTSHSDDAGAVCVNASSLDVPDVDELSTTTRSITITWPGVTLFPDTYQHRYVAQYNTSSGYTRYSYTSPTYYGTPLENNLTIGYLSRDTMYTISVRQQFTLRSSCGYYYYINGPYSSPITVSTDSTVPSSIFKLRLIPPISGINFMGRVEVYYQNTWGTVCDNSFDTTDANVICSMLNFTGAACAVPNARLGRGSGKIWLNNLRCSWSDEILDHCGYTTTISSSYYSGLYCRSNHYDDAGVICYPSNPASFAPAPQDFNGTSISSTSIRFTWRRVNYPSYGSRVSWRYHVQYSRSDYPGSIYSSYTYSFYSTSLTLYYIPAGVTVNATVRLQGRFNSYYCYTYLSGEVSDEAVVTLVEMPPTGPPLNFHITVFNCSAINAEWTLPSYSYRNGIIRGYKLMYKAPNEDEVELNLSGNVTEYLIGNLSSSTSYEVSVLAYTVGDGPRSIFLTAMTNNKTICQTDIIDSFGIGGNDIDKVTVYSYYSSLDIFCGSNLPSVQIDWLYSNGTKVGITNRNVREAHFSNGTTLLQMGRFGRINICDAGTYICRANQTTTGRAQQKTFTVTYNSYPVTPPRPELVNITATTAIVVFSKPTCDGNHPIQYYTIRVGTYSSTYYYYSRYYYNYRYFYNIDARLPNYTINGLNRRTMYMLSVSTQGSNGRSSSYSLSSLFTTLDQPPPPPRAVSVELTSPNVILVKWSRPSVISGQLLYYTVYAKPLTGQPIPTIRTRRQALSLQTIEKNFSSSLISGNVTLLQLGVEYHVQVAATIFENNGTNRQSLLSTLTPNSTIYVPIEGLPFPQNVRVLSTSNTSVTLSWTAPQTEDTITGYLVLYFASVEGRSRQNNLIQFTDSGNATFPANSNTATLNPLLPQTSYIFRVATLTKRGEGRRIQVQGTTSIGASDYERFVYFHVRFGPVFNCQTFRRSINGIEDTLSKQIYTYLEGACNCGLTQQHITREQYGCGQWEHQIIYRAQILGTRKYSATDLVNLLQDWIEGGNAYIFISPFKMTLDPTCPTSLDMLSDPECPVIPRTGTSPIIPTEDSGPTNKVQPQNQNGDVSPASAGGFAIGAIIAILLLILIILIVGILLRRFRNNKITQVRPGDGRNTYSKESGVRFNQFDNSSSVYDDKDDDDEKLQDF